MKKLLFLSLIAAALLTTNANAQGPKTAPTTTTNPNPTFTAEQIATMIKQVKEKQVPMLVEKAGLTNAQAERVVEINYEIRVQASAALQGLNDADRSAKIAEFKVAKEKKYSEIPLSADQIKAVYAAYEDMGKNMERKTN